MLLFDVRAIIIRGRQGETIWWMIQKIERDKIFFLSICRLFDLGFVLPIKLVLTFFFEEDNLICIQKKYGLKRSTEEPLPPNKYKILNRFRLWEGFWNAL